MPLFNDDAQSFKAQGSGFHFSGVGVNDLGASEYTLVGIACDTSSSVSGFDQEIETCLKNSIEACQSSPRADNLLLRILTFASSIVEQHGFRPLIDCHTNKYTGMIKTGGITSLYDASVNMIDSMSTYGTHLIKQDYTVNGIVVIITDGMDVGSTLKVQAVAQAVQRARQAEALESLLSVLVGVNVKDSQVSQFLQAFKAEAGLDQYVEAADASPKTMARIANFISKSVSSQSQSLNTGSASQPITF